MVAHIPIDMLPHIDCNSDDKLAAWSFYRERLEPYFIITHTPKEDRVTHILFFDGKEPCERWTALKE